MKDHEAFWLLDGKTEPKKPRTYPTYGRFEILPASPLDHNRPGFYVARCRDCDFESEPMHQMELLVVRRTHAKGHA